MDFGDIFRYGHTICSGNYWEKKAVDRCSNISKAIDNIYGGVVRYIACRTFINFFSFVHRLCASEN